jgi:hypothetical protein
VESCEIGEIPIFFLVIETVTYDKSVRNGQTCVIDADVDASSVRFVQQYARPEGCRVPAPEKPLEVREGKSVVDDILDDYHILTLDTCARILEKADLAARPVGVAVARDDQEVDRDVHRMRQCPREVCGEEQSAFQDSDEDDGAPREIVRERVRNTISATVSGVTAAPFPGTGSMLIR